MSRLTQVRTNDRVLALLTGTIVSAAVIAALYLAQRVLIPVALAVFFAFLLTPVVMQIQRWGFPRVLAVITVALFAVAVVLGFGWLVTGQIVGLGRELPDYTANVKKKIEAVQAIGKTGPWHGLEAMLQDLRAGPDDRKTPDPSGREPDPPLHAPQIVPEVVDRPEPLWLQWLPGIFRPASEFLGQVGLIIVLAVFILLAREDLRNRFIQLLGHGRLTVTTKAVDDASQRLSRFLLMQLVINLSFGLCVAVGLALIGVRYAILWGVLATVMRFVPYIGTPIAAIFPVLLSIAQFESWLEPGLVVTLLLGLELLTANVFEPLFFGRSIGVSAVALLVAAAFWAFLWGPIGLVLSCPLTVCLVVLGKYVPYLAFLNVLLSDEPALAEDFTYYQRLSARDEDEATDIVLEYAKNHPLDDVYDALLIPALTYVDRDRQNEGVDEDDVLFVQDTTRQILADVQAARQERKVKAEPAAAGRKLLEGRDTVRILGIPSRGPSDEIALEMLRQPASGSAM